MSPIEVSVVIPMRNAELFVEQAVRSMMSQTLEAIEILVIDDGSDDHSYAIVENLAAEDTRVCLFRSPGRGIVDALNLGVAEARAPLIARMDADDVSLPHRLQVQRDHLQERPRLAGVGSWILSTTTEGAITRLITYPVPSNPYAVYHTNHAHPTMMLRRDAVRIVGGYRDEYPHAEDLDLWTRLVEKGYPLDTIPEPLLLYRQHANQISAIQRDLQAHSAARIVANRTRRSEGESELPAADFSLPHQTPSPPPSRSFRTRAAAWRPKSLRRPWFDESFTGRGHPPTQTPQVQRRLLCLVPRNSHRRDRPLEPVPESRRQHKFVRWCQVVQLGALQPGLPGVAQSHPPNPMAPIASRFRNARRVSAQATTISRSQQISA